MLVCLAALQIGLFAVDSLPRPISELGHTRWTLKDGAPAETEALAQTIDGYLWIGTRTRLVRFDGVRFVPFRPPHGDTIPSGGVRRLLASRDGSLWIVWRTGAVSRFRAGRVVTYGEQDGLPAAFVVTESSTGTLVAGTANGLSRFANGKWLDVNREWHYPRSETRAAWFDSRDVLWAQTENRVVYLPSGIRRFVDPGMVLRGRPIVADFAETRDGAVWMAEYFRSVHTLPRLGDEHPIAEVQVSAWTILADRRGSLWVGSGGDGLRRVIDPAQIRGKTIARSGPAAESFTEKDGLLSNVVLAMLEDRGGDIWVATSRGLEQFRDGPFTPVTVRAAMRPLLFTTRDTTVWVLAFNYDGNELLTFNPRDRSTPEHSEFVLTSLAQDSAGTVWAVTDSLLLRLDGRRFVPVRLARHDAKSMMALAFDPKGTLWLFDVRLGLLRLRHDSLVRVAPLGHPRLQGVSLFSDSRGRIWIGQENGIALYDNGRLRLFDAAKRETPGEVYSFFEDRDGNVWAAGETGLAKFEDDHFRYFAARQRFPGATVSGIVEDDDGAWWIRTRTGVLRVSRGEMSRALADSNHVIAYRSFDQRDGFPGAIDPDSRGPLIRRAADGRIWVATDSGVAWVNPPRLTPEPTPVAMIEAVRSNNVELPPTEAMGLPSETQDLEIDYTATMLSAPDRVQFRYRLDGKDRTWHDAGTRRRAYYSGLGPGTYRFHVAASTGGGVWSGTEAVLAFRVLPAWYETIWLRGSIVLLVGALGALAAVLVQRRRHLRAQEALIGQYEATLAERARIAQDLHDTLLQGFAGATLQLKTAELALPGRPDVAAETIRRVQRLARESLREARERVWEMRQTDLSGSDLPSALEAIARDRSAGAGLEVSVVSTGERRRLTRSVEDAAFRIGREAIVNALRHSNARRIEIHVDFGATTLRLEVQDDGRGLTLDEAEEARKHGHFGLTGARERAASIGGRCDIRARPEGGTVVGVELPLIESGAH